MDRKSVRVSEWESVIYIYIDIYIYIEREKDKDKGTEWFDQYIVAKKCS